MKSLNSSRTTCESGAIYQLYVQFFLNYVLQFCANASRDVQDIVISKKCRGQFCYHWLIINTKRK